MPAYLKEDNVLFYKGANFLKQRLLLATLSGKPIRVIEIRSGDVDPGLREYEVSLIRLFEKLTNGTKIELNETGTALFYCPGLLHGGQIHHDCNIQRGIGYYLDILLALGPFCKLPLNVVLRGVTNSAECPSVDHIKSSAMSTLKRFLVVDEGLELKVVRRGVKPAGGGEVLFRCPVRNKLRPIQCTEPGMVKRIRGTVYACKVSPALANRTVEAAKGVLLKFIPDIYIHTDQNRGKAAGACPGYGVCLYAETTEEICLAAESVSRVINDGDQVNPSVPEELGREAAFRLLEEIYRGGCVDSAFQWLVTLFMALGQKDVSKFLTGPLSEYTINFLQHLREFFAVTFKLENPGGAGGSKQHDDQAAADDADDDQLAGSNKVLMTCVGIGYSNINKRMI